MKKAKTCPVCSEQSYIQIGKEYEYINYKRHILIIPDVTVMWCNVCDTEIWTKETRERINPLIKALHDHVPITRKE